MSAVKIHWTVRTIAPTGHIMYILTVYSIDISVSANNGVWMLNRCIVCEVCVVVYIYQNANMFYFL